MPNQTDWILLKKTINSYNGDISETWGFIDQENSAVVANYQYHDMNLFEFLLTSEHFSDANTIASCIPLFDEDNIQLIYNKHHSKYHDILKLLCADKMILLYEEYYEKVHNENAGLTTDNLESDQELEFNSVYRSVISKRYEKMVLDSSSNNIIIELINEFKFLTHPYLEDFYNFSTNIKTIDYVSKFNDTYKKYLGIVPLIYRLINEYYLEYVKYQIKMINDIIGNSFIVAEYYNNLKKCVSTLPNNYIDYRYQDKSGNNILYYLSSLPYLSDDTNREIYQALIEQTITIPIDLKNSDGNTIFHTIAIHGNKIFLEVLMDHFFRTDNSTDHQLFDNPNDPNDQIKNSISEILLTENIHGKTIFDILFDENNFDMLIKVIDYMPPKSYLKLTNRLIENFDIIDSIPSPEKLTLSTKWQERIPAMRDALTKIYLESVNYFMDSLLNMMKDILYDLNHYNNTKSKIIKLLSKCPNQIDLNQNYYLEWVFICIKINELELFKLILSKFFNEHHGNTVKYLNRILNSGEPIIISAIRDQKIQFVKILLVYGIDLSICDEMNRNSIIVALETKNIFLIRLIRDHVKDLPEYRGMVQIMDNFIDLIEEHETFNTFSIHVTCAKLIKTIEYAINYFLHKL